MHRNYCSVRIALEPWDQKRFLSFSIAVANIWKSSCIQVNYIVAAFQQLAAVAHTHTEPVRDESRLAVQALALIPIRLYGASILVYHSYAIRTPNISRRRKWRMAFWCNVQLNLACSHRSGFTVCAFSSSLFFFNALIRTRIAIVCGVAVDFCWNVVSSTALKEIPCWHIS